MRASPFLLLVLATAGCHARVAVPAGLNVSISGRIQAQAQASAGARVEVEAPVALEGAPVVEFFGIPLEGAEDVVFVLDRSGSMDDPAQGAIAQLGGHQHTAVPGAPAPLSPRKIDVAHDELVDALSKLPEGTSLNVLFFNDQLQAFAPGVVTLDASSRELLVTFVKAAWPDGSTALAPAMRTALLMSPRRVVLLSDGLGNVGGDSDDILRDAREAMLGGVRIDTIGIGADQDAALLSALAGESGGIYQQL